MNINKTIFLTGLVCTNQGSLSSGFLSIDPYDLVFVLSAVVFNLLIAAIFIATKGKRLDVVRKLGTAWMLLGIPLLIVFIRYLIIGRPLWVMLYFVFILFYMLVELLLDYVFKVDFRSRWITHIPYILLEYVALFGLIGISFELHYTWGYVVSISFWILLACLVYLYAGGRKKKT
jgi:hypothetical protein